MRGRDARTRDNRGPA